MIITTLNICPKTLRVQISFRECEKYGFLTKRTPTARGYQLCIQLDDGSPELHLFEHLAQGSIREFPVYEYT